MSRIIYIILLLTWPPFKSFYLKNRSNYPILTPKDTSTESTGTRSTVSRICGKTVLVIWSHGEINVPFFSKNAVLLHSSLSIFAEFCPLHFARCHTSRFWHKACVDRCNLNMRLGVITLSTKPNYYLWLETAIVLIPLKIGDICCDSVCGNGDQ